MIDGSSFVLYHSFANFVLSKIKTMFRKLVAIEPVSLIPSAEKHCIRMQKGSDVP